MAKTATKRKVKMPGNIRQRLSAALCMLLVSSVMLVSSTYAWFTLSTAPEVSNIDTTVAGNGSLEIALMPTTGLLSSIGSGRSAAGYDGSVAITTANTTWGNIINLSDESYGLNQVNLNPAVLNLTEDKTAFADTGKLLSVAAYGYDGRVEKLDNASIATKSNNGGAFNGTTYGVRAIGEADAAGKLNTTYGYIVDLAVRLNTTQDNGTAGKLLLQTNGAQRIYTDGTNAATLGGGSYMKFADTTGLNMDDLMNAVRVTFVQNLGNSAGTEENPLEVTILGTAKLDTANKAPIEGNGGYTAKLYLTNTDGNLVTTQNDAVLISTLNKNAAAQISAIVWLDGTMVKNSSVSAINTTLAQATLNLQFATDVALHPTVNSALRGEVTPPAGP